MYKHYYRSYNDYDIELVYSIFHKFTGNGNWYVRIWRGCKFRSGYGDTKFEAYRNAIKSELQ